MICIVIPTRNRPSFLHAALSSLVDQDDGDFTVVVSDNSDDEKSMGVCQGFRGRLSLQYQRPNRMLSMVENWNFAVTGANAEYVAVMIDKTVWNSDVIRSLRRAIAHFGDVDVVSWSDEPYVGDGGGCERGLYVPLQSGREPIQEVDLLETFRKRREFNAPRRAQTSSFYCLGKICFGVYSSELIKRICSVHNQLFHPLSPDYSSMALASLYSRRAIQLGVPMQLSFQTTISNGFKGQKSSRYALEYISSVDPQLSCIPKLPLPGLYQSQENTCAYDLIQFDDSVNSSLVPPNIDNLTKVVSAELWHSGQVIDTSFVSKELLLDLVRKQRRLKLKNQLRRYAHPSRNALALKVRSSGFVYEIHRLLHVIPGLRNQSRAIPATICSSPEEALRLQVELNRQTTSA